VELIFFSLGEGFIHQDVSLYYLKHELMHVIGFYHEHFTEYERLNDTTTNADLFNIENQ